VVHELTRETDTSAGPPVVLKPVALGMLPETPLVSVLMSNYNYEQFLGDAIESVLAQTYKNVELIICDDGSTDGSCAVAARYEAQYPQVKLIRKSNGGQASGFNEAWRNATGSVICFLDADDLYRPERLRRVVDTLAANPEAGVVIHHVARITASRELRGVLPLLGLMPSGWCGPAMLRNGGILGNLPVGCVCCLRREVAERIFPIPFTQVTRNFGDTPIIRLAPLISPIISVPEVLYEYRMHGRNNGNISEMGPEHLERELQVYQEMWKLQRTYLAGIHPQLSAGLVSLESNQHVSTVRYLKARLERDFVQAERSRKAMRPAEWLEEPMLRRWFWKVAPYMPDPIFRQAIQLLFSQNRVKQTVAPFVRVFKRTPYKYV
jgi:glycosyltransferase involved in cell wall biosynthesis